MSEIDAITRIDKFLKQLDDHDVVIDSQKLGKNWGYYQKTKRLFGYKDQYVGSFAEMLARHLATYQQAKDLNDSWLRTSAINDALYWLNQAHAWNIVKPSDGIYRKYENCLDQIKQLTKEKKEIQEELQQVSADLLESEAERKTLKRLLDEEKTKNAKSN